VLSIVYRELNSYLADYIYSIVLTDDRRCDLLSQWLPV